MTPTALDAPYRGTDLFEPTKGNAWQADALVASGLLVMIPNRVSLDAHTWAQAIGGFLIAVAVCSRSASAKGLVPRFGD